MKSSSSYRSPELLLVFPTRLIIITGSLLGAFGCYSCLLYTYVFQYDRFSNFMSSDCPGVLNYLPPASYPVGDWEPQRFIWMLVMFAHFPARLFFPLFYKCMFGAITSESSQSTCFRALSYILSRGLIIEALGLVILTVFDVRSDFTLHAVGYGIWLLAFMINAIAAAILQHISGLRALSAKANRTFFIRVAIFFVGGGLCLFTAYAYIIYRTQCSDTAYLCFSISEYILVMFNGVFHLLPYWECNDVQLELVAQRSKPVTKWDLNIIPEKLPLQVISYP